MRWILAIGLAAMLSGCGESTSLKPEMKPAAGAGAERAKSPATPSGEEKGVEGREKGEGRREKATVGVGEKGRGYGSGPVATPVAAFFATKERLVFDIQIPHSMNAYKAEHGHAPKTHEEFWKEIIQAGQIRLPDLPPGHKYVYDPKLEQLMVEKPGE